jgi:cell division protein FtsA
MEEIIDHIVYQLEGSDCMEKLTAGLVITGGGSQLRHLPQLIKYRTGLDVRTGIPNVQVSNVNLKEVNHPMYSTSVGLLYKGFENRPAASSVIGEQKHAKAPEPEIITGEAEKNPVPKPAKKISNVIDRFKNTIETIFDDGTE